MPLCQWKVSNVLYPRGMHYTAYMCDMGRVAENTSNMLNSTDVNITSVSNPAYLLDTPKVKIHSLGCTKSVEQSLQQHSRLNIHHMYLFTTPSAEIYPLLI